MVSAKFNITGMHCSGCVRTVTNALKRVAGVREADVSLQEKSATVLFDAGYTTIEDLQQAIRESGYEITTQTS